MSSFSNAALVNRTIDDTDTAFITYMPADSWQPWDNLTCADCKLEPQNQFAVEGTYHFGFHSLGTDNDKTGSDPDEPSTPGGDPDAPSSSNGSSGSGTSSTNGQSTGKSSSSAAAAVTPPPAASAPPAPSGSPPAATSGPTSTSTKQDGKDGKNGGDDDDHGGKKSRRRGLLNLRKRADSDDPNFVDTPVNVTINFTGTAVYVFGIVPVRVNNASVLSITNLTFLLDGQSAGAPFLKVPEVNTTMPNSFNYQEAVFTSENLTLGAHTLVISPFIGSMLFLDSVNYTVPADDASGGDSPVVPGNVNTQAPSGPKKKNVATFAIAVGCTVGILAILAFSTCFSIWYRRKRSARREKMREAREASLRPPSPEMRGLHSFVPRYFPGAARPPSISNSVRSIGSTTSSSLGPSHGLNYPIAPEIPVYAPPPGAQITEMAQAVPVPLAIALRPPVSRVPEDDDVVPPSYAEAHQTPLLPVPPYTPSNSNSNPPSSFSSSVSSSLPLSDSMPPILSEDETSVSQASLSSQPLRRSTESTRSRQSLTSDCGPAAVERPLIPTILDDRPH